MQTLLTCVACAAAFVSAGAQTPPSPAPAPTAAQSMSTQPLLSFGELEFNNLEIEKTVGRVPKLAHNNPGLLVDVGVGLWAWPLPMDYNGTD